MTFLNPILLLGLAAVAVPILIHLLNRRKFQKVVWAAMRFLQSSVERNQRRMRLEDMILLALRCLLLALLALALARPAFLSRGGPGAGQTKVTGVIILDNSYSLGMSDGALTRFEKARQAAEQALDAMPAGSAAAVFLASDIVQPVIPEPTFDLNLARKTIREAPLSDHATDLFPALDKAAATLKDRLALRKEIYLVTDGQALGWRQLGEIQQVLEHSKADIKTHVLLVTDQEDHNVGIGELRLASGLAPARQALRFEVRVGNYGKQEVRDLPVTLSVDGEPPMDEFTIASLPPGAHKSISLFAKLMSDGYHAVTARIPEDRLRADDRRTIVVRAIKEFRILLVDGDPGNEPRDSQVFFLKNALVPVSPEQAENYFIKANTITFADLGGARFDEYDAVVLANVVEFSDLTAKAIEEYVRRGGGLVIFPGSRVNATFYNEQLFQRAQLLPARLGALRGQADQDQVFFGLQDKNFEHGIVSIWNDPAAGTLSSVRFFRAFALVPPADHKPSRDREGASRAPSEAGEPQVVVQYADGTPAIVERTWGLGRVVLFSSTANTAWNDWPVRPSFVPLIHRTLGAILQRQDENLNLRVGARFSRRIGQDFLDKEAVISRPGQTEAMRDLRRIELANGWPVLQYDQTDFAGVYEANISEPPLAVKFAAQPDPAESSLEILSAAQLNTLRGVAQVIDWTPHLALKDLVEKDRTGFEFWFSLVVAALVVAGVETCLAQRFSLEK
jgi:hypothetical protein